MSCRKPAKGSSRKVSSCCKGGRYHSDTTESSSYTSSSESSDSCECSDCDCYDCDSTPPKRKSKGKSKKKISRPSKTVRSTCSSRVSKKRNLRRRRRSSSSSCTCSDCDCSDSYSSDEYCTGCVARKPRRKGKA